MAKQDKNKDSLFLLEVLVDKIIFAKPFLSEKEFKTCILIESPNLEPLEICDDECGTASFKKDGAVITNFNCGKSCLFSMKDSDITLAMNKFNVKATVFKCLPCGCLPERILIGEANIDMTKEFVQARNQFLQDPSNVSYEALKDSFRLHGGDGVENGEIWMFLRLSCFGKLIVTRFQGAGPRAFGAGGGSNVECATNLPCNAGSGANAPCPPARNAYSSQPCVENDDMCYCNGPRPTPQQPVACRNTGPYCLHVPKGAPSTWLLCQDLTEEEKKSIRATFSNEECNITKRKEVPIINLYHAVAPTPPMVKTDSVSLLNSLNTKSCQSTNYESAETISKFSKLFEPEAIKDSCATNLLGNRETTVYMTLFSHDYCRRQTSGTQATGSLNKCLQVRRPCTLDYLHSAERISNKSSSLSKTTAYYKQDQPTPNVYYCSKFCKMYSKQKKPPSGKKDAKTETKTKGKPTSKTSSSSSNKSNSSKDSSKKSKSNNKSDKKDKDKKGKKDKKDKSKDDKSNDSVKKCENKGAKKENKGKKTQEKEKGEKGVVKGEMYAAVSHIIIGPREPCPYYGREPCQGPKCIQAKKNGSESEPVKVTTVTNSRRGVFELVIRKLNGAPLARNELMLEWTPPLSRHVAGNCVLPCYFVKPCRPSRTKIVCRKPKCRKTCRPVCGRPSCSKCCKSPCQPSPCVSVCRPLCNPSPCGLPCKSSPCLRPCPVGYRRPRRYCSQPRIRPHKKRTSPCHNRAYTCPVVKCRSMPFPCARISCCPIYTLAPRRSISTCRTKCCISSCRPC